MKTKVIFEFDNPAEMQALLDAINGNRPTATVVVPAQESPAPAPQETVSDREAVATPVAAAPPAEKRTRARPAKTLIEPAAPVNAPAETAVEVPATSPEAAAPFVPPLGPTFTLDKPKTAAPASVPTSAPSQEGASTPSPAAAVPALAKVQDAVEAVLAAKGTPAAMASLSRFGVKRGRELKEEQRADFIAYCGKVIAGTVDPLAGSDEVAK